MSEPSRIRAVAAGNNATVRVLMSHDMESGQRKDANAKLIPAWHIQEVTVLLNGKLSFTAEWGTAVAKNPFMQFTLRAAKVGDKVAIQWKDNRGESRTDEAIVAAI